MEFRNLIEQNMDALVRDLQGCIQIPSVYQADNSGYPYGAQVHKCLEYMLRTAEKLGFRTGNLDNHVGWCEYGEGEEMVAVLGHLDVVPEGDGWTVPPYGGTVQDGRIYGRGTMDDKGPTMCALYGLKVLRDAGVPIQRRIRILFGLNEETGSADMKYYRTHGGEIPVMGFTPDGEYPIINGEKGLITETYCREIAQSGDVTVQEITGGTAPNIVPNHARAVIACDSSHVFPEQEKITITRTEGGAVIEAAGVNAHACAPEEGENAIGRLMQYLAKLPLSGDMAATVNFLSNKLGMESDGASLGIAMEDEVSGALTMNFGYLRFDGTRMELKLNYRYPVTKTYEMCGPIVLAAFENAGFEKTSGVYKDKLYMAADSPLVTKLLSVYRACTGDMSAPKAIGGGTYAKMIPNVLAFGPIFPGDEVREHKPDEFMELSRLADNTEILANAMYTMAND